LSEYVERRDLRKFFLDRRGSEFDDSLSQEPAFTEALCAESEMVDDFVLGALSEEERRAFLSIYLTTDNRVARLEIVNALRRVATESGRKEVPVEMLLPARRRLMFVSASIFGLIFMILAAGVLLLNENVKDLLVGSNDWEGVIAIPPVPVRETSKSEVASIAVVRSNENKMPEIGNIKDIFPSQEESGYSLESPGVLLRIINTKSDLGIEVQSAVIEDEDGRNWEIPIVEIAKGGKEIFVSIPADDLKEGTYLLTLNAQPSKNKDTVIETARLTISATDDLNHRVMLP